MLNGRDKHLLRLVGEMGDVHTSSKRRLRNLLRRQYILLRRYDDGNAYFLLSIRGRRYIEKEQHHVVP